MISQFMVNVSVYEYDFIANITPLNWREHVRNIVVHFEQINQNDKKGIWNHLLSNEFGT